MTKGRGKIIFPGDFTNLSNIENVKKALLRLEKKKILIRLAHGIYLYPKIDDDLGILYPSVEEIAHAIAKRDKAQIIPTGIQALNKLGLSEQVPMNLVYLTNGAPRKIQIGKRTIKFKNTTPKNLAIRSELAGLVIQALKEIGKDDVTQEQINHIRKLLEHEESSTIRHDANLAPAWIARILLSIHNEPKT